MPLCGTRRQRRGCAAPAAVVLQALDLAGLAAPAARLAQQRRPRPLGRDARRQRRRPRRRATWPVAAHAATTSRAPMLLAQALQRQAGADAAAVVGHARGRHARPCARSAPAARPSVPRAQRQARIQRAGHAARRTRLSMLREANW
jgi:hypothetical protein